VGVSGPVRPTELDPAIAAQLSPHADLVQQDAVYAALQASWMSQSR
jgi:hypothetical protein